MRRRTTARRASLWVAVLVVAGGLTSCGSGPSGAVSTQPPAHHTTARPVADRDDVGSGDVRTIPHDVHARLGALSTIPGHPERRLAEWYVCPDHACHRPTYALVVTSDGFETSHPVDIARTRAASGWCLEPAGRTHFAISPNCGRRSLVDLTGRVTRVHLAGTPAPLGSAEIPLRSMKTGFEAVNPTTAVAHPLSTPSGTVSLQSTPHGQLRVTTLHRHYLWSADRGATWRQIPVPAPDRALMVGLVPTTSDSVHAVQLGGDGATLFPWDHVLRSTDGRTWTSYDGPGTPHAYGSAIAVLPDGDLLVEVDAWNDQRAGHPAPRPVGLYAGADWGHLAPVHPSGPFAQEDARRLVPNLLDVAVTPRSVTLYAQTPDRRGAVSSTDGGRSWRSVRAR